MLRKSFLLHVHPDQHAEYERRHNKIWPDLVAVLKEHGAQNYSIFLDKKTNQLFAYVEIESEELWEKIATTDACQRWWEYNAPIMPGDENGCPEARELVSVFHLP